MNTALFLLSIALTAAVIYISYRSLSNKGTFLMKRSVNVSFPAAGASLLWMITASEKIGAFDPGPYSAAYLFMAVVSSLAFILSLTGENKFNKEIRFAVKLIMIASLLELTVFNLPSYKLMFSDYPEKTISAGDLRIVKGGTHNSDSTITAKTGGELVTEITGLDIPVGTVYADIAFLNDCPNDISFIIDAKDSTHSSEYRFDIAKTRIISSCPDSYYALCELSGKVSDIRLKFCASDIPRTELRNIVFNRPIPVNIMYMRFIIIVFLGSFIYCVLFSSLFSKSFSKSRTLCNFCAFAVTVYSCWCAFAVISYKIAPKSWQEEMEQESGNQITQELVDAFEAGSFSLLKTPEDFLSELENPYDTQARDETGQYYSWDHVYYNDHYYSYYGIAPVILLFMPYHIITGFYFPNTVAILLLSVIGIIGLTLTYLTFTEKWFPDMPAGIVTACHIILMISCGIWYSLGRTDIYEIAIASGFAFFTWAVYFFLKSDILGKGNISLTYTAVSSLFLALSVLSRPTLALYCICAAVFMILAVPKAAGICSSSDKKKLINRSSARYLLAAFVPMGCLGIIQMYYNFRRFGSPLDFGIQYSLTINDFTKSQFHAQFSWMAIYNYLFNIPSFSAEYPFVRTYFQYMNTGGYFYADIVSTLNTSGLFILVPTMFFWFIPHRALREMPDRRTKILSSAKIGIPCMLIPIIIIASVWESGYAVRYMADFSFEAIIGSYTIMFFIYLSSKNDSVKKLIKYFVCFSLVWVTYTEIIQIVNQTFRYQEYNYEYPEIAHKLEQLIAFWK